MVAPRRVSVPSWSAGLPDGGCAVQTGGDSQAVSVLGAETGRQPHSPSLIALPVETELGQAARLRAAVSSAASQTRGQAPLSCGVPGAIARAGAPPVNS